MFLQTHFLLGRSMFLQRHDAVILVIKQLGFGQIAQGLVRIAVPDLNAGSKQFAEFLSVNVVGAIVVSHRSFHSIHLWNIIFRRWGSWGSMVLWCHQWCDIGIAHRHRAGNIDHHLDALVHIRSRADRHRSDGAVGIV